MQTENRELPARELSMGPRTRGSSLGAALGERVGLTRYIGRYNFWAVRYIASYIRGVDWRFAGGLRAVREG